MHAYQSREPWVEVYEVLIGGVAAFVRGKQIRFNQTV